MGHTTCAASTNHSGKHTTCAARTNHSGKHTTCAASTNHRGKHTTCAAITNHRGKHTAGASFERDASECGPFGAAHLDTRKPPEPSHASVTPNNQQGSFVTWRKT